MYQNNGNPYQQYQNQNCISPNQVAQATHSQLYAQQMTPEQLQRTQVLNFDDFKATARIEKISSKKPAAVLAFLGVFLILLGVFFPTIESLSGEGIDDGYQEYREDGQNTAVTSTKKDEIKCVLQKLNNENGTDEIITVNYVFLDKVLKTYTKEYLLKQSESVTETPGELGNYLVALEPYLAKEVTGFTMTLQQITNGSITTSKIDYDTLDYNAIPLEFQSNYRFDVPFQSTATMEEVKAGLIALGYTCE